MQSKKYNTKIKAGEDLCKAQLRLDAVSIGPNAIIATDIDYADVGGDKGMLMVCMSGTAIKLANPGILAEDIGETFAEMDEVAKQLFDISKYTVYASENPYQEARTGSVWGVPLPLACSTFCRSASADICGLTLQGNKRIISTRHPQN